MILLQKIKELIKHIITFICWKLYDVFDYYKNKKWLNFDGFGLHVYVGMFGSGKTSTMVHDAYKICKNYSQVTLLTNMSIKNFPSHTKVIKLENYNQIITAPPNTLILLDEISNIFNSRNWKKEGIPANLLGCLLQVRKERKMLYCTAQRFQHVDALIRQITFSVRECKCWCGRWNWITMFDAWEYENENPMKPARAYGLYSFIQTNKIRSLYDTMEMVEQIKKTEYISDAEILEKQGTVNNVTAINVEKKKKKFKII